MCGDCLCAGLVELCEGVDAGAVFLGDACRLRPLEGASRIALEASGEARGSVGRLRGKSRMLSRPALKRLKGDSRAVCSWSSRSRDRLTGVRALTSLARFALASDDVAGDREVSAARFSASVECPLRCE